MWYQQRSESRGIPEAQYYDGRIWWEVNKHFSSIINVEPYKCPWYQQWYLETLWINQNEKWDKDFSFLKWRKWFKKIKCSSAFNWYEFVDSVELWPEKKEFFLALSYDRKKAKVWEKHQWEVRDITMLFYWGWTNWYLEFEPWLSEKLTKTYFVGKNIRKMHAGANTTIHSWWIKRYQDGAWYFLTDTDTDNSNNTFNDWEILPWDYIYLIDTWEVWTVTVVEKNRIRIAWAWRMTIHEGQSESSDWPHTFAIFSERTDTFIFQTKAWPVTYHNIDNSTVQMLPWWAMYWGNLKISGMTIHQDNLYFIDRKSWRLYYGWNWIQQMVVASNWYTEIWHKFMRLDTFQDYIIMSWPSAIWAAYWVYTEYESKKSMFNLRRQELVNYVWVWWEHSIKWYPEWIQLIWSDWLLYWLGITPTGTATWILIPALKPQSYYIVDDIKRLHKDSNIYLHVDWMNVKIFINNLRYPNWSNDQNTKVLIYDYHHRFWYKRMIKWLHINNMTEWWVRYWAWVFENTGETDDWNKFKQIISAIVWEGYSLTGKFITMMKLLVWQHSKYTKWNTEIKIRFDNWGRSRAIRYDDLWSSEYIKYIMDSNNWWTIWELLDWTIITNNNWVPWAIIAWFNSEFNAYESYESTMKTELWYDYTEDLAKWWKIKLEITAYADVVYIDLVSKNWDNIDFGWFLLWFAQTDTDTERLTDTLWIEN